MAFNNLYVLAKCFNDLAGLYSKNDKVDSSIRYSRMGFEVSTQYNFSNYALIAARILARDYESKNALDSTLKYTKITVTINDSIFSKTRLQQFQLIVYADQERKKQLENARAEYSSRLKIYLLLGVLILSY